MASEKIEILKNSIKLLNPNFQDGKLITDTAFKQIENYIQPNDIVFGCRINQFTGLMIGTSSELLIVEKSALGLVTTPYKTISYSDITDITQKPKFICDQITITAGRLEIVIELDKTDSNYITSQIRNRMQPSEKNDAIPHFVSNVNLKGIKLEILGRNFEEDFKLVSSQKELYFQRITKQGKEKIQILGNIKDITQLTEENKQSILKKAGWGFAGGVIGGLFTGGLAIAGLLAGVIAKGNKKEVCFACELYTGERFLAKAGSETFQKLLSISL